MKKIFLLLILLFSFCVLLSQKTTLYIKPIFCNDSLAFDKKYYLEETDDSVTIHTLKMYISDIFLFDNQKKIQIKPNYFLINSDEINTFQIPLTDKNINYTQLSLLIGTDEQANISANMKGVLDPIHGMYWVWQSGYINIKIEGFSKKLNDHFTYHLGGYQSPYETAKNITTNVKGKNFNMKINISDFLLSVDYLKNPTLMLPGKKAVTFSDLFVKSITFQDG